MAKTKLTTRIFGGKPPFSLKIMLFKGDKIVEEFEEASSFEHTFNQLKGDYSVLVSGPNPMSEQRKTEISIDATEIKLSKESDANPAVRVGRAFMVQYFFTA